MKTIISYIARRSGGSYFCIDDEGYISSTFEADLALKFSNKKSMAEFFKINNLAITDYEVCKLTEKYSFVVN